MTARYSSLIQPIRMGEIKAVAYDAENDNIIAERTLTTAGKETILVAEPELTT